MQILFAAPFLLAAGMVFTLLSAIPRARRWAIPIPAGIIGAGASSLLGFFLIILVSFSGSPRPHQSLTPFFWAGACTGVVGGVLTGAAARVIASFLPAIPLRIAVLIASWSSYFVLMAGALLWFSRKGSPIAGVPALVAAILLSLGGAWLMARDSEQFRPERMRFGTSFRGRNALAAVKPD